MTGEILKRIGMGYQIDPREWQDWQLRLAERIPPMAVFSIFKTAVLRAGSMSLGESLHAKYLELQDHQKREAAVKYLPDLARCLGFPVHIAQHVARAPGPVRPILTREEEIALAEARHEQRQAQKRAEAERQARLEKRPIGRLPGHEVKPVTREKIRESMRNFHMKRLREKQGEGIQE